MVPCTIQFDGPIMEHENAAQQVIWLGMLPHLSDLFLGDPAHSLRATPPLSVVIAEVKSLKMSMVHPGNGTKPFSKSTGLAPLIRPTGRRTGEQNAQNCPAYVIHTYAAAYACMT